MEFHYKIKPLNTREKILFLVEEVKKNHIPITNFDQFVIDVSFQIRKKNLQILFQHEMTKIKDSSIIKKPSIKISPNKKLKNESKLSSEPQKHQQKNESKKIKKEKKIRAKTQNHETHIEQKNKLLSENSVLFVSPKNIVGRNSENIISTFKIQPQQFYKLLKNLNISRDKIFTRHDFNKLKIPLNKLISQKAGKLMSSGNINIPKSVLVQNERNKMSYGKPGNYGKLIYYGPKT